MSVASYVDFVDWKCHEKNFEPSMTMDLLCDNFQLQVDYPDHIKLPILPNNKQEIEGIIGMATKASAGVSVHKKDILKFYVMCLEKTKLKSWKCQLTPLLFKI